MRRALFVVLVISTLSALGGGSAIAEKTRGIFFSKERIEKAQQNAAKYPWAAKMRGQIVRKAQPWMKFSDDELWNQVFGATISRSHMVWSNGHCPACKKPVKMYSWRHNALKKPWKVWCPHCGAVLPTNDFHKFYKSGLDEHGIFDPKKADRSLLFNAKHPDPNDPKHLFGVDDGEGYVDGKKRWRFIGWYINFAHWSVLIHNGIVNLSAAHALTGDPAYAHKAGILLDRLADVWPGFDYRKQGFVYERRKRGGSIRYSIDTCMQVRNLAFAYDQVFESLTGDESLIAFLADKAKRHGLKNAKTSFDLVQENIEQNLFGHALSYPDTIASNYPQPDITRAVIKTVLNWPESKPEVEDILDTLITKTTSVDGVSGEKGMASYSSWAVRSLGEIMGRYAWVDPNFLQETFQRHPQLRRTWRFFIDLWCFQRYYPLIGDTWSYAARCTRYMGLNVLAGRRGPLDPSPYTFLWELYKLTGDVAYVQVMVYQNGGKVAGLPLDIFAGDPATLQKEVAAVIARHGPTAEETSTNKPDWCLAMLKSGQGEDGRALWMSYDAGGSHGQCNGMNIGLFARGTDFMPEFGYPRVGYGGFRSAKARWYRAGVPSHNTVCVDGKMQHRGGGRYPSGVGKPVGGRTTLWADGECLKAVRASASKIILGKQFERTVGIVAISESDCYLFDIFRVVGGKDHAKFQHTQDGTISTHGLTLKPAEPYVCELGYGHDSKSVLKDFQTDTAPKPAWCVDWHINPIYKDTPKDIHFRYTDLTQGAQASLCKGWVEPSRSLRPGILWLPMVMVRRTSEEAQPASTFVAVMEPYRGASRITGIRRMPLLNGSGEPLADANVAVAVTLDDGRTDMIITRDVEDPLERSADAHTMQQKHFGVTFKGDLCFVRRNAGGLVTHVVLCNAKELTVGAFRITMKKAEPHTEIAFEANRARVVHGDIEDVAEIRIGEEAVQLDR